MRRFNILSAFAAFVLFCSAPSPAGAYDTTATNYSVKAKNINNVLHVGGAMLWAGDIGAQINAAYAALPSNGGTIVIDPPVSGSTYDFTTPIVFATAGKIVQLVGMSPAGANSTEGVSLNYTPTSGAAITLDYATNIASPSSGFSNINLVNNGCATRAGCGGSAIGINNGTTNDGDAGATYLNVGVQGFAIGYQAHHSPNEVDQNWIAPSFRYNAIALKIGGNLTEHFLGGTFVANDQVVVSSTSDGGSELYFVTPNIFDNTGVAGPIFDYTGGGTVSSLEMTGAHLETCGTGGGCSPHFIAGALNLVMTGGIFEQDASSGTCDWMVNPTTNGTVWTIVGTKITSACAFTEFFNASALTRGTLDVDINSFTNFPTLVGGTNAGLISSCPVTPYGNTTTCVLAYPMVFKSTVQLPSFGVSSLPTCNTAAKGTLAAVPNALSPTWGGTLTGGGTVATLAFCDGTNWVAH